MFRRATVLLKHPGAALVEDFPGARVVTISRPGALNSLTYPAFVDMYKHYVAEPHPNEKAIYILRGDGPKAFSTGGDLVGLTANINNSNPAATPLEDDDYASKFFLYEYTVDCHIATMKSRQVALWAGHVYGSGVGVSLHGSHRVCFSNTKFAMPEVQIGTVPDIGSQYHFARLPIKGMGPYLALTGNTLSGADVFHAGLATHYVALDAYESLLSDLKQVRRSQEVADVLETHTGVGRMPPFTLATHLETLSRCFAVEDNTTVSDVMARLAADGTPFAQMALEVMKRNSPTAMCMTLEAFKVHRQCRRPVDSLKLDYKIVHSPVCLQDFKAGASARILTKSGEPQWNPTTVEEVDMAKIKASLSTPKYELDPTAKLPC